MKHTIIEFKDLSYEDQYKFLVNALNDNAHGIQYKNSTGKVIAEYGVLFAIWCDAKFRIDSFDMKYVMFSTFAYTKQAFIHFKENGDLKKKYSKDVWGKGYFNHIIESAESKVKVKFPNVDECTVFISPYKKDYR